METATGAGEFGICRRQLQTEGGRLGVDAVAAADGQRQFVFDGASPQRREQRVDVGHEDIGGTDKLQVEASVQDIGRGQSLVDVARLGADQFGEVREERDDVVLDLAFDRVDASNVEFCFSTFVADGLCGLFWNHTDFGHGIEGMRLDFEPDAIALFGRPDRRHFLPRVARNHAATTMAASRSAEMFSA